MFRALALSVFIVVATVNGQQPVWGQCGGSGWQGGTTCASGSTCTVISQWYSQCLPGSASPPTQAPPSSSSSGAGSPAPTGITVYLAGDSTTAPDTGTAYAGWGTQIGKYLSVPVKNDAVAGKSSRSFTDLGYFSNIINSVKANDVVVIEFGHNEGGGPAGNPQQGVCPGTDLTTTCNDNGKVVYTYFKYMEDAVNSLKAKGAKVIVSSQTPNNPFKDTSGTPIYVSYAQQVASQTGVTYVDHFSIIKRQYTAMGATAVNALFPIDNIHTSSAGADVVAQAFVRGVLCGSSNPLAPYVSNKNVQPCAYYSIWGEDVISDLKMEQQRVELMSNFLKGCEAAGWRGPLKNDQTHPSYLSGNAWKQ